MRRALAATFLVLSLAACGDNGQPASKEHADHPAAAPEASGRTPSPPGAKVFILEPKDGAAVKNPITVKFGVEGMSKAWRSCRPEPISPTAGTITC